MRICRPTSVFVACLALAPAALLAQQPNRGVPSPPQQLQQYGRSVVQQTAPGVRAELPNQQSQQAAANAAAQAEAQIVRHLQQMEQQLRQSEQVLNQHLARAQQLRQQGLQNHDGPTLQRAEQMERQAIQQYQQRLEQFEQASRRLSESTRARAEAQAAQGNSSTERMMRSQNQGIEPRAPQRPQETQPVDSSRGPFRRWFGL